MRCDIEYLFSCYVNFLENTADCLKSLSLFWNFAFVYSPKIPASSHVAVRGGVSAFAWGGAFQYSASPAVSRIH